MKKKTKKTVRCKYAQSVDGGGDLNKTTENQNKTEITIDTTRKEKNNECKFWLLENHLRLNWYERTDTHRIDESKLKLGSHRFSHNHRAEIEHSL